MEEEKKFNRILELINTDIRKAVTETNKLDPKSRDRLKHFLAHSTLHTESARYRGRVIEVSIYLELTLAQILSNYFAKKDKIELLNSIVFDRMDLQRKLNTLKSILKLEHASIWKKELQNIKKIDTLISFRNNLAHSVLNSSPEYLKKISEKVGLLSSKGIVANHLDEIELGFYENNNWVYKKIKWSEIEEYHREIYNAIGKIQSIRKQITPDYEPTSSD